MATNGATGKIVQIIGPVVDVAFPEEELPDIYDALEIPLDDGGTLVCEVQGQLAGSWVRAVAMSSTDGLRRGMTVIATGDPIKVPVGPSTLGPHLQRPGHGHRHHRSGGRRRLLPDPPPRAHSGRAVDQGRSVRDRHQGHRPDRAVHQGRQDGDLRRRGRGQDGRHPGADPQHRQVPLRLFGVRRRGRAQPRGQRPLARDARFGRHQQHGDGLRPDE